MNADGNNSSSLMPKSSRVHVVKAGHPAQANPKGDNPSSHNSSPISVYQCLSVFIGVHLWFKCLFLDQRSTPRFAEQRTGGRSLPSSMSRHPKTTSYEPSSCFNPLTLNPIPQTLNPPTVQRRGLIYRRVSDFGSRVSGGSRPRGSACRRA